MALQREQLACLLGTLLLVQNASCSESSQAVCESGMHSASVSLLVPSVPLKCSQDGPVKAAGAKFCGYHGGACDEACNPDPASILKSMKANGTWSKDVLTIDSFPPQKEKICFVCSDSRAVACTVVVDIAKAAQSCTNGKAKEDVQARNLDLTLAETQTVYFSCPDTDQLSP
ncbi:sag-related sequence srs27b, partial [Cystoisospora suis]